ncbi:hypothetical protein E1264_02820 [Actinomadura sp. KC216]|nr:hypothetical protein E1264_02820 [Actinomadura sp. KC216]
MDGPPPREPDQRGVIEIGASPRATLGLAATARALALISGRDYPKNAPTPLQNGPAVVWGHSAATSTAQPVGRVTVL